MIDAARMAVLVAAAALVSGGAALTVGLLVAPTAAGDGTDYGLDTNGNGRFDWLVVLANVTLPEAGLWDIGGTVLSSTMPKGGPCGLAYPRAADSGLGLLPAPEALYPVASVYERYFFEAGPQTVRLAFPGTDLFRSGVDGPYRVDASLTLNGGIVYGFIGILPGPMPPSVTWSGTTGAYLAADFEEPARPVAFTGDYTDAAVHVDDDGLYDILEIRADVRVTTSGQYTLNGALTERAVAEMGYRSVGYAYRDVFLETSDTSLVLRFRGDQIRLAGIDGPWDFSLTLYGGGPIIYDGRYGNVSSPISIYPETLCGTTSAYRADAFDDTVEILRYTGRFEESTVDYDGDAQFDVLIVRAEVDALLPSGFDFQGVLAPQNGSGTIASFFAQAWIPEGVAWTDWTFLGPEIRAAGVDGPYLARLSITPSVGGIDPSTTYLTKAYRSTDFDEGSGSGNRSMYWIASLQAGVVDRSTLGVTVVVERGNDLLTYVIEDTLTVTVVDASGLVMFRAVDRVVLPSGGYASSYAYTVQGLAPGTYTVVAILGPEDRPVDARRVQVSL